MESVSISSETYRVGFIGAGKMAESIARGVVQSGVLPPSRISTSHSNPARRNAFESFGITVLPSNDAELMEITVAYTEEDHDQAAIAAARKEWFKMVMEAGQNPGNNQSQTEAAENTENQPQTAPKSKIQEVVFLLRDHKNFSKYFEPRVVSLGPIHHGKPKYRLAEKYKLRMVKEFVESSGKNIEGLYEEIVKTIKELRECFEDEVTKRFNDERLAWMLFVDGCAILQFIYCAVNNKFKELKIKTDSAAFGQQDLFLLENQLPYRLLERLMGLSKKEKEFRMSIESFIQQQIEVGEGQQSTFGKYNIRRKDRQSGKQQAKEGSPGSQETLLERSIEISNESEPIHLLDLLRTRLLVDPPKRDNCPPKKKDKVDRDWQSYRNVQELRAAGIQMKRTGNKSHLRNICFTKLFNFYPGYLWLPPIVVDDSTGPKFFNLIAYEMCPDFDNDFGVTSYISFLDSLIDEASDVKVLRKAEVLHNFLGSDDEVAKLFNEIGTDLVPNLEIYNNVKLQIQSHYRNRIMTWIAQFFHLHFSSPWTILAFLGALFALGLSAAQTWYAVKSSQPGPCDGLCKKLAQNFTQTKR